jgi:hypothetical protein
LHVAWQSDSWRGRIEEEMRNEKSPRELMTLTDSTAEVAKSRGEKQFPSFSGQTSSAVLCVLRASAFPGECLQKRIALATGRRIIAINLPVVGEVKSAPVSTTQK